MKSSGFHWTFASAAVLSAVAARHRYGFDIMEATGLPSGTVYPALRRLGRSGFLRSDWEAEPVAQEAGRPRRKYYELTARGEQGVADARERFPMLAPAAAPAPIDGAS